MICVQFIFVPGTYDEEFFTLDGQIEEYARALPGFDHTETWVSQDGRTKNAVYYFTDQQSVAALARFPQHREAKGKVAQWYDNYRIVVSDVRADYGDKDLRP